MGRYDLDLTMPSQRNPSILSGINWKFTVCIYDRPVCC